MTEDSSEQCFSQTFGNNPNSTAISGMQFVPNTGVKAVINNRIVESQVGTAVDSTCAMYTAAIPAELAGNLPEGTVFQIMPDAAILAPVTTTDSVCETIVYHDLCLDNNGSTNNSMQATNNISSIPNYVCEISEHRVSNAELSNAVKFPTNISDIDLSFLTESDEPNASSDEIQSMVECSSQPNVSQMTDNIDDNACMISETNMPSNTVDNENCVLVDVSKPIQLSQNSLIVVNGMKCVMQQDPQTGQVVAYPVKEPDKPKKKRGRPRKVYPDLPSGTNGSEEVQPEFETSVPQVISEEESNREKGLLEIVTDDGALVRRSSRKRKRKVLNDYETGNLNQELGSDVEEYKVDVDDDLKKKGRSKTLGRPKKYPYFDTLAKDGKRSRGRPKQFSSETESVQSFLIQTTDGQTMMVQVPVSIIPAGMSLEDVAQRIANNFNVATQQMNKCTHKDSEISSIQNSESTSGYSGSHTPLDGNPVPSSGTATFQPESNSEQATFIVDGRTSSLSMSEQIVKLAESLSEEALADILNPASDAANMLNNSPPHSDNAETEFLHPSPEDMLAKYADGKSETEFPNDFEEECVVILEQHTTDVCSEDMQEDIEIQEDSSKASGDFTSGNSLFKSSRMLESYSLVESSPMPHSANIHFLNPVKNLQSKSSVSDGKESDKCAIMDSEPIHCGSIVSLDHKYVTNIHSPSNVVPLPLDNQPSHEITLTECDISHQSDSSAENNRKDDSTVEVSSNSSSVDLGLSSTLMEQSTIKQEKMSFGPVIDIQKCFAAPVEIKSLQHILPAVSSSASSTMVIPLPDRILPLIVSKTDGTSVPLSSLNSTESFECLLCKSTVESREVYYQHLLSQHPEDSKKCKCCKFVCLSDEELTSHFRKSHPRCICPACNYTAEQPHAVKRHMYQHSEKGITCKVCHKTYKDHYILKMHMKMVHMPSEIFYKCEVCDKEFNRKAHMKRHLRTHAPDKPYKCAQCDYRGCEKSDITKHMLIHEEPKHLCETCGKTFRHLKNKELHIKRHNNQRDFKCGICDFFGYTFTDIRKHIERRHTDQKGVTVVICNGCEQVCKSHEQLKAHQKYANCKTRNVVPSTDVSAVAELYEDEDDVTPVSFDVTNSEDYELLKITEKDSPGILDEGTAENLTNGHFILNNVGDLLNSNGQIIISGLDGVESLSAANLKIISSADESSNKEVIIDSNFVNENLMKLFDSVMFNNNQNQNIPCQVSL